MLINDQRDQIRRIFATLAHFKSILPTSYFVFDKVWPIFTELGKKIGSAWQWIIEK